MILCNGEQFFRIASITVELCIFYDTNNSTEDILRILNNFILTLQFLKFLDFYTKFLFDSII